MNIWNPNQFIYSGYLSYLLISQTSQLPPSVLQISFKNWNTINYILLIPPKQKIYVPFSIQKLHIKSAYIFSLIGPLIKFTFGHPYF